MTTGMKAGSFPFFFAELHEAEDYKRAKWRWITVIYSEPEFLIFLFFSSNVTKMYFLYFLYLVCYAKKLIH